MIVAGRFAWQGPRRATGCPTRASNDDAARHPCRAAAIVSGENEAPRANRPPCAIQADRGG
jgi:hypothetical protein